MGTSFEQLREYVFGLEIIYTHEHLPAREEWRDERCDVLGEYLVHYMNCDLVSAGLPREQLTEVTDPDRPLRERWRTIEPFWTAARNTGYARALDIAVRDKVLAMVAATLSSAIRPLDAAVRWGGEEFILVCPNVAEAMSSIAERIRMMVEQSWVELEDGKTLSVTISVGAAKAVKGDSLETLVNRADARMYEAKNSGRNRCVVGD